MMPLNLVAEETAFHAHTHAQTRAAEAAKALDEPIVLTTSSDDQTIDQIAPPPRAFATTTDKIALPLPRAKIAPQPPRAFVSITNEIALSTRQFFGSSFSFKFRVFEDNSPFVD